MVLSAAVLVSACGGGGGSSGSGVGPSTAPSQQQLTAAVHHVIVIIQENRTVDNLFAGFPGADTQFPPNYQIVPLTLHADPRHDYDNFVAQYHGQYPEVSYSVVRESDIDPYWQIASHYGFADEVLQSSQGQSFPAHQYLIAGQAGRDGPGGTFTIAQNPFSPPNTPIGGCNQDPTSWANQINLSTPWPGIQQSPIYPCLDYKTIFDLLDTAGLSWKYYTYGDNNNFFTAPLGVQHLYQSGEAESHLAIPTESKLCADIANQTLPAVSYVISRPLLDDHPLTTSLDGPKWVGAVANLVGQSPYWKDTTILVTWDDWGGWYDHVRPRIISSFEYGFRVPLLVISPWLKRPGVISHVARDQTAILHYIESVFHLPSLGMLDAKTDDLRDMFVPLGTTQHPLNYTPVGVGVDPSHFCSLPAASAKTIDRE
ncbi:MAG: hypothetical protein JO043_10130 [Candidatus Eremiobacteraeota bacterium]|nr:hypothetical protein [Candidatus Eremiobacteraeota bacterium]